MNRRKKLRLKLLIQVPPLLLKINPREKKLLMKKKPLKCQVL